MQKLLPGVTLLDETTCWVAETHISVAKFLTILPLTFRFKTPRQNHLGLTVHYFNYALPY